MNYVQLAVVGNKLVFTQARPKPEKMTVPYLLFFPIFRRIVIFVFRPKD